MIDAGKRYAAEHGSRAITAHAGLLIVVGVIAMILKRVLRCLVLLLGDCEPIHTTIFTEYNWAKATTAATTPEEERPL